MESFRLEVEMGRSYFENVQLFIDARVNINMIGRFPSQKCERVNELFLRMRKIEQVCWSAVSLPFGDWKWA